jgi:hypothetical protein
VDGTGSGSCGVVGFGISGVNVLPDGLLALCTLSRASPTGVAEDSSPVLCDFLRARVCVCVCVCVCVLFWLRNSWRFEGT